jgi:lipoprotein-releasing system permease protein
VLIIALFNVIGSIIMVILDKQDNIKTLYNVGASVSQIKKVFLLQGTLMTLLGGVLGLFVGVLIIYAQLQFNMVMITPSLPYPVSLTIKNILIVFVTIMSLGIIASYIASSRIHRALA